MTPASFKRKLSLCVFCSKRERDGFIYSRLFRCRFWDHVSHVLSAAWLVEYVL